ncbi:MAG: DUF1667 domain-containing protein [Lachnospiraceae bacterium]|nr:DUF1667 domain-containing protein [Lachnospiraceae bacterium]
MEMRELTCIGCPLGCSLTVTMEEQTITVTGNTCSRGEAYAKKEVTDPTRIVTSSVKVEGGVIAKASVKTSSDIPKGKIFECMKEIRACVVKAPVRIGDVVIANCAGTGVSVVATKDVECL